MDNLSSSPGSSGDEASVTNETNTANMTRRPNTSGRGPQPPKRTDIDLGAILSIDQKLQLQQLMANTLDTMQKSLRDTFDLMGQNRDASCEGIQPPTAVSCTLPNPRSVKYAHLYGLTPLVSEMGPKEDQEKEKEKEKDEKPVQKEMAKVNPVPSAPTYSPTLLALASEGVLKIPKSIAEASAMNRKDETDALTSGMMELKRDALTYFGKWRGSVVRRLGEIIIKDGGNAGNVMKPAQFLAQGNNARRLGSAGRGRPQRPISGPGNEASNRFPTSVPLGELPKEKRLCILHSMLLLLLGLETYQTHSRVLLLHLASALGVPLGVLAQDEVRLAKSLAQIVKDISQEEITKKRAEEGRSSRRWKGGSSAVTNNATTGVLAAPLVSVGVGTVFGGLGFGTTVAAGLLGTMAESTVVVGNMFGLYGARATSKMGEAYVKEIQDFALIPLHGTLGKELVDPQDLPAEDRRLRLTVGISGWLEDKEDTKKAWMALGPQSEAYALRWELDTLTKMDAALEAVLKTVSWTMAKQEIRERSVFDSLKKSIWPMDLIKISKVVDNPWTVGMVRAEKAGGVLADAILNKFQGERGVTLIGYGLGARVIYACLMHLSEKRVFGAIENAVMLGTPCPTEVRSWTAMRSVVAGRLVNVHSKNDYLLGFMYRTGSWQYGIAGLEKIQGVHGVENLDVSDLATNHIRYQHLVNIVLKKLNWEDVGNAGVARDEDALRRLDAKEALLDETRCARSLEQGLQAIDLNARDANRKSKPTGGEGTHKGKDNSNRRAGGKQGK